ncbi:ATP-binding cassette transporter snq2 [Elasticomyces elasticus]|nr:ATP-binding cassette transporter snq2 [Elasticomyces elasticus]KAK3659184.1 ATP-binding cassette transporter snq2 [Elasticomyces elasticus]KAK4923139.1 ATP-binding cassette transporter snq2 [Elasticomyces elasticus]KAK5761524.1 ATP-binding cassette transporter snq2 [Elasticomyces elasticus]
MEKAEERVEEAFHLDHPTHRHGGLPTTVGDLENPQQTNNTISRDSEYTLAELDVEKAASPEGTYLRYGRSQTSTRSSLERDRLGVNVVGAEKEFAELQRELSHVSKKLSRQQSRRSERQNKNVGDLEKAGSADPSDEDEPFNLEETLRGNKQLEEESGVKGKQIGVIWENLTVKGMGGSKTYVPTFPDAFTGFFGFPIKAAMSLFGLGRKGKEVTILKDFYGVAKPGEMVLVLGKPGSGCTTFLKSISNQRYGYTSVGGEVLYGPFTSKEFGGRYRGEAVYCQEDDIHHPTLTVGQTLGFALETKVPETRPGGLTVAEFRDKVVDMLLRMFNIEHTKNTIVGNPFVRGISGGERKRVSIAEMMIAGAAVCSHDNSTRGLDASTAVDYAKSLRVITNIYRNTTFVSLYQASENIYKQFDKVMVIDDGRQVFLGPIHEARAYFEGLGFLPKPRQTTPDYLTGCTDPFEREYQDGRDKTNAPNSPDDLVSAFASSTFATRLQQEMADYRKQLREEQQVYEDFKVAVIQGKRHASKKSVYSIPFYLQIWALMKRQFILKWQDRFSLVTSYTTSIVIAIVTGTVWLQQPRDSAGAFTRGGVIFISLLFNCFQAFAELASTMVGRPMLNKHKAYTFHRPSALWIAQIGVDLAFSAVQILLFSIIVYFMCGLVYDAGAFFTFYLIIVTAYLAITLFFRTVGCMCPDFDSAIKIAALIITLFVLTSGYLIQYEYEQVWLRWIFYINALGLGFAAMMINEFSRIDLQCTGTSLVPSGPGYGDINHQVCILLGSRAGTPNVSGSDYLDTSFSYSSGQLWRDWGIIVVLVVAFLVTNAILGEFIAFNQGGKTITFFTKENDERKKLNEALQAKKAKRGRHDAEQEGSELNIESKAVLTWEGLCYDVPVPSGQLRLLKDIYGYVKPGELTALMGASGAGKTTLLDVLASRKNIGVISGDKLVDGIAPGINFQRGTSYAEQLDVHESCSTVREALRFSADLRQPYETPQAEKFAYVEEIITLLEMEDIADAIIGDPEAGLAVEQRKRVTIGVELAAKPELLLFLDEPTSGLDSQSAFNVIRFLRKLAAAGQAILCTIHQPNASLFESFDRLLLLQRGGECVYFGDIGKDANVLIDYFHENGADCPPDANPAEWMLDAIGAGQAARIGDTDWAQIWRESEELEATKEAIVRLKAERKEAVSSQPQLVQKEYAAPLWHQIKLVSNRQHRSFWRSPNYGFTRFFNHVAIALLTGLMFLNLDDSRTSLQYRVFVIFQVTVLPALILAQVEPMYDLGRLIYYREAASKTYKQLPFALSMVLAEMPYSVLCAVGFFVTIYYPAGFSLSSSRAGYFFIVTLVTELFSVTLAQALSALTPSTFIAVLLNPFVIIIFALFCGVTVPKPQIPGFWRAWLYELDPFTRLISGLVSTELHNMPVVCKERELNHFTAPIGQSCGDYMENFFSSGGPGYIVDNATSACSYCAYKVGDQFYEPLGISFDHRWRDFGILTAFIGSNLILLFLGSRYLNFNRR